MTAHDIIANGLFNQAVNLMDDEIREELHASGDYDGNDEAFLEAYMAAHEAKFGEQFTI